MFNLFMKANRKRAKRRGFTLIELVIVIVILGVLAGVAALSFQNVTKSSREGVAKANLRALKSAVQVYQVDHKGELPPASAPTNIPTGAVATGIGNIQKYVEKEVYSNPPGYEYHMTTDPATGTAGAVTKVILEVKETGTGTGLFSEKIEISLK